MKRSIDLDALVGDAGEVVLGGVAYPVLPMDGAGWKALLAMRSGTMSNEEGFAVLFEIAKRVCPTLAHRIETLDIKQIGKIVEVSGLHIVEMEQHPKSSRRSNGNVKPPKKGR